MEFGVVIAKIRRILIKTIISALVSVAVFIFLLLAAGRIYLGTDQAQHQIQNFVNGLIPGKFSWRLSSLDLLGGSIELGDILVTGPHGEEVIRVGRLFATISWPELLRGRIYAEKLVLEKPRVYMALTRNDDFNMVTTFVAPDPAEAAAPEADQTVADESNSYTYEGPLLPFNILVKSLRLSDGFVAFEMINAAGQRESASLDQVRISLDDGDLLNEQGRLLLQTSTGTVDMAGVRTSIDRLQLQTTLGQNRFEPIQLQVEAGDAHLNARASLFRLWVRPLVDLDFELQLPLSRLRTALNLDADVTGLVAAKGKIKGDPVEPEADVILSALATQVNGLPIDRLQLACLFKERFLTVRQLNMGLPRGEVTATGRVDLRKVLVQGIWSSYQNWNALAYEGTIVQPATDIATLLGGKTDFRGKVASSLSLAGVGVDPQQMQVAAQLAAESRDLSPGRAVKPLEVQLTARAVLDKGRLVLEQGLIDSGDNRMEATGSFALDSQEIAAALQVTAKDLDRLLPPRENPTPKGAFALDLQLSGTPQRPLLQGRLEGQGLHYLEWDLGTAQARFQLADGVLQVNGLSLTNKGSQLTAEGSLTLLDGKGRRLKDPVFTARVAGSPIRLGDFRPKWAGTVTFQGEFTGSISRPEGCLQVEGKDLDLGVQKIKAARLTARLTGEEIQVAPLTLVLAPGQEVLAEGWLAFDKTYALRVRSQGIGLGQVAALTMKGVKNEFLYFDVSGCGRLDDPSMSGNLGIGGLAINENRIQDLRLALSLRNQTLRITGEDLVRLDGGLDLQSSEFSATLDFDRADLTPFIRMSGREDLFGSLQGRVTIKGNVKTPEHMTAAADLSEVMLRLENRQLLYAERLQASFQEGRLVIPGIHLILVEQGYIDLHGEYSLDNGANLWADGSVPLGVLRIFSADAPDDLEGELKVTAGLQGPALQPDFRAEIGFSDLTFTIPELMQKMQIVSGRIKITPGQVVLENLTGRLDTGELQVSGDMELAQWRPARFAFRAKGYALPLTLPEVLEALVNAELEFKGTPESSLLSGEIVLLEGQYIKDVDLNLLEIVNPSVRAEKPAEPLGLPLLENISFDIALRHRNPFMIANNLALLALKPDLRLYGSLARPLLSGRAEVESGTITYQKREFEVHKGLLDFINPYKIEPEIMVKSSAHVRDWTIYLDVSGTKENLKYSLRSEPSEQQADILSLMVFGKTTRELMERDSDQTAQPSQILADYISKELQDTVKDTAGLDSLAVEYQARQSRKDPEKVKVTMGKELSRRVTLKYGVETDKGKFVQSTTAEYRFLERLLMSITQNSKGEYGGEVSYRIEFR